MKVLFIGGTGFSGPKAVDRLLADGCEVMVFHRGRRPAPRRRGLIEVLGDRRAWRAQLPVFKAFEPDVIVDMIAFTRADAEGLTALSRELKARPVAISSADVYLAYGRLAGSEPGPTLPGGLGERSALRATNRPFGESYDKLAVERIVRRETPDAVILRFPVVYGPGDGHHRLFPIIKRVNDGREAFVVTADQANWRSSRCYVDHAAQAIALATQHPAAVGQTYNVADRQAFSDGNWALRVGRALGWAGVVVPTPRHLTPPHLCMQMNFKQDWVLDTDKIRRELGFEDACSAEDAIARAAAWESANPPPRFDPARFDYAAEDAALKRAAESVVAA